MLYKRIADHLVMIMLNAVFSAYEMALASISRTKLTYLVQTKVSGATEALVHERPHGSKFGRRAIRGHARRSYSCGHRRCRYHRSPQPLFSEKPGAFEKFCRIFELSHLDHPLKLFYHHLRRTYP